MFMLHKLNDKIKWKKELDIDMTDEQVKKLLVTFFPLKFENSAPFRLPFSQINLAFLKDDYHFA